MRQTGPPVVNLGVAWTALLLKAITRPKTRTIVKAQNNSFCHRCGKLYLTWEGFKHACVPYLSPTSCYPLPRGWALLFSFVFARCRSVRLHFRPRRLQLRSRYRSIIARAPKLQRRSSSLHRSHLKSMSNVVGWMQGLEPCITSAFRKHCD